MYVGVGGLHLSVLVFVGCVYNMVHVYVHMWCVCAFYVSLFVCAVCICVGGLHPSVLGFVCCVYNVVHVYGHIWCVCACV